MRERKNITSQTACSTKPETMAKFKLFENDPKCTQLGMLTPNLAHTFRHVKDVCDYFMQNAISQSERNTFEIHDFYNSTYFSFTANCYKLLENPEK